MQGIPTMLTDEQESFVGTVLARSMPTYRACLGGIMSIDLDSHALMQEGFVGNHGVQLGKSPLGISSIRFALLLRCLLALASLGSLPNIRQVLNSDQCMGMLLDNAFTHD